MGLYIPGQTQSDIWGSRSTSEPTAGVAARKRVGSSVFKPRSADNRVRPQPPQKLGGGAITQACLRLSRFPPGNETLAALPSAEPSGPLADLLCVYRGETPSPVPDVVQTLCEKLVRMVSTLLRGLRRATLALSAPTRSLPPLDAIKHI